MTLYDDVMRTIIDLPNDQLEILKAISSREKTSRAEIVRRAVGKYILEEQSGKGRAAFGLWKKGKANALKYERRLRAEWEER
jgi:metal-responsive CopG/Arc/MetJ family transcriptional regulator